MASLQSYSNHARTDSPTHFFVFPVLIANVGVAIWIAVHFRHPYPCLGYWAIVVALALLVLAFKCRVNDLKLQDRIIRLEERLRIASWIPADQHKHIPELTLPQLIALRFASDEELAALVHKTLTQNLEPKAIKQSITTWRPDNHRV